MKKFLPALFTWCFLHATAQTAFQETITTGNNQASASATATADGGYILAGDIYVTSTNSDMYIVKLDAQGNLEWDKSIGGTQYDHAIRIIQTNDGGYAVAGNSGDNRGTYMRLVKLNATGEVQWSKYYSANKYNGANTVLQTPDGGYALGGYVQTYNNGSAGLLVKTDGSGNTMWSKRIFDISFYPSIQAMVNTSDGGFAAVLNARTTNSYYDMFIIKLSGSGGFQWGRSIGGESTDMPKFILQTKDNGYLFGGSSFSFSSASQDMFVVKTDSAGSKKWSEKIATDQYDYATDAVELPGKLYVIAGATQDPVSLRNQPYAVLLNKNGKLVNSQAIIAPVSTVANAVVRSANGSILLAGHDPQDVYIARFTANGKICGDTRSAGTVTDTANLLNQTVPVTNLATTVSEGIETATEQNATLNTICIAPSESISPSSTSAKTLSISVYPNPVKDALLLQLNISKQAIFQIEIVSFTGKIMWRNAVNVPGKSSTHLDVSLWEKGVYYVVVHDGNVVKRFNFLKE